MFKLQWYSQMSLDINPLSRSFKIGERCDCRIQLAETPISIGFIGSASEKTLFQPALFKGQVRWLPSGSQSSPKDRPLPFRTITF